MNYEGTIIRPPNEAGSVILQITVGCSHNKCTFCPAYKEKKFRIKSQDEIEAHIMSASAAYPAAKRVFLCDGDPLIIDHRYLSRIIDRVGQQFPQLKRIGMYANAKSILRKTADELAELRNKKVGILYMGLESGDAETLKRIQKGSAPDDMIAAAGLVKAAGMKINVSVLLGAGGKARSREHARHTIEVLNTMQPNHIGALTLMVVPGTPLYEEYESGRFIMPDRFELLDELRIMVVGSELHNCLFYSNHASNYFPIEARLPRDKEKICAALDNIIESQSDEVLRPEWFRGL